MFDRAVVNAGPLVALSLLDQLDLLPALFAECWVPQAVFNEVAVEGIGKPGAKSLQGADWQARVRVSPFPDPLLVMELDVGEAEVISLARQLSPCVAIIDELMREAVERAQRKQRSHEAIASILERRKNAPAISFVRRARKAGRDPGGRCQRGDQVVFSRPAR